MKNLDYIDDYFNGTHSSAKTQAFEKRVKEEPQFAEEVAFYLTAMKSIREEVRAERKEEYYTLFKDMRLPEDPIVRPWVKIIRYAAAAVVLIGLLTTIYLFSVSPASKEQLADNYIQENFATLNVSMGVAEDSLEKAKDLYNKGRYQEAMVVLDVLARNEDAKRTVFEYAGITCLRLKQYDKALQFFDLMAARQGYGNAALFYQALTRMRRNKDDDLVKAKDLLQKIVKDDLPQKEVAQKWLDKW
jgi:tetratricopeptide (TPR) repeat protein